MTPSAGSILAGYRLLAWLFPARPLAEVTDESFEDLSAKFKRRDSRGNWLGFLLFLVLIAVYFGIFLLLDNLLTGDVPKDHYEGPFAFLYFILAGFLSLCTTGYITFLLLRLALWKEDYDVYMAYGGEKIRRSGIRVAIDFEKTFRLFFLVIGIPLALASIAYIDTYASFTEQNIIINPFWTLGKRTVRPYTDVKRIYEVENIHLRFEDKFEPYQLVVFNDGTRWETDHGSLDPKLQHQRDLMEFVSRKSGKPVKIVRFAEDIPGA